VPAGGALGALEFDEQGVTARYDCPLEGGGATDFGVELLDAADPAFCFDTP
jgi:hypothetical protein